MQTILFHSTIFGPIRSRRLGTSLGVNLSPVDGKICSFDCLYCEAGFNAQGPGKSGLPPRHEVRDALRHKLAAMKDAGEKLDVITFSGNGEPTVHPDFAGIIDDTIAARDEFFPDVKISVLSNSTQLHRPDVVEALKRVDNNILKLDSAVEETMRAMDRPVNPIFSVRTLLPQLAQFGPQATVQTMFTRGEAFDNTTPQEVDALIEAYKLIRPGSIMVYTIDRPTPDGTLRHIPREELDSIASRITAETGIPVSVAG